MRVPWGSRLRTVNQSGAPAGSVLCGAGRNNRGLRLRVFQDQEPGLDGAVRGDILILDAGDNLHSEALQALLRRVSNAAEVLGVIRRRHPACVNVTNGNILALEGPGAVSNPAF